MDANGGAMESLRGVGQLPQSRIATTQNEAISKVSSRKWGSLIDQAPLVDPFAFVISARVEMIVGAEKIVLPADHGLHFAFGADVLVPPDRTFAAARRWFLGWSGTHQFSVWWTPIGGLHAGRSPPSRCRCGSRVLSARDLGSSASHR